ncbi:MAG: hypothetical protein AAGD11_15945 [Planctomycetota bacterium]
MLAWRLKIREARTALNAGRPEEASQILQQDAVRDFLPAKRLSQEVAQHLIDRAEQRFRSGDSMASWSDLQQAARLGGCDQQVAELRQHQAKQGLQNVQDLLVQGETKLAAQQIAKLEQRSLGGSQRRAWKLIVHLISKGQALAEQGKFGGAVEMTQRALRLLPDPQDELADMLAAKESKLEQQHGRLRQLTGQLHDALSQEAWTDVLTTAEAVLELAPRHNAALQARSRAWDAVGMKVTQVNPRQKVNRLAKSLASTHAWKSSGQVDTKSMKRDTSKRIVAWIDGIGGYLICLGDDIMLGQPVAGSRGAEIPILADLSRRHASIRREGEAYVIAPIHRVRIDGVELSGPQVLSDGVLIELGDSVKLRFRKPHALSGTAVLAIESNHKTDPAVDGIVLMSESCVLGSQPQSHISCRGWTDDLVLFRRDDTLQFRTAASVEVDGEPTTGSNAGGGVITDRTCINAETFSLSFEEI